MKPGDPRVWLDADWLRPDAPSSPVWMIGGPTVVAGGSVKNGVRMVHLVAISDQQDVTKDNASEVFAEARDMDGPRCTLVFASDGALDRFIERLQQLRAHGESVN
jgi:hypothetical protein